MIEWFVLGLLGAIWGASYLFIKIGGAEIPPFTFVAVRMLLAGLALLGVLVLRRERPPRTRRQWMALVAMGIFNGAIPYTAITWGELSISSGLAAILTAAMPLFTVLLAHFWTRDERLTWVKIAGVIIGFVGVAILFLPDLRQGVTIEVWSDLAIIVAAASYGTATLIAHKYLAGVSHVVASAGQLCVGAAIMSPLSLMYDHPWALVPSWVAIGSLVILSLVGTGFAYVLYYWLIEHTGATRTALVTYLIPITGIFWGAAILNETIAAESLIGLGFIIVGIGFVNRKNASLGEATRPVAVEGQ